MPMPHQDMRRLVKRRIVGTEGTERLAVLKECLEMCPNYFSGPYGELRKWIGELMEETRVQKTVKYHDQFAIPKEGAAQVVLVGPPNAGKSSLLKVLTGRQVAVGDYPFTTLRPIAGMIKLEGASVQLVDLPGLLEGAIDGKGGGRALLACVRSADAIIYVVPATEQGVADGLTVLQEVRDEAAIDLPAGVVVTKTDLSGAGEYLAAMGSGSSFPVVGCSTVTGDGLSDVSRLIWNLTGLIRVYPRRRSGKRENEPVVLLPGSTIESFVLSIHRDWLSRVKQARVTGPSARFPGMSAGLNHVLADGDEVELVLSR